MSTLPNILQDARKRDHKARTFVPPDNDEMENLAKLTEAKLKKLDPIDNSEIKKIIAKMGRSKDLERSKFSKNLNEYERINLNDVNDLIDLINSEITEGDNIVDLGDDKEIYFRDLTEFLYDIKDGKISNFNEEREYEKRLKNTEKKLENRTKFSRYTRFYEQYINMLKEILFSNKKSSGRGLTISSLLILLSELNINSSKELINDIEQLINTLYDNKQITKQVYKNLLKAITYKNDS